MLRALSFILACALATACGGKSTSTTTSTTTTDPDPSRPLKAKKVSLSWGIQPTGQGDDAMADIYLAMTDETGSQVSHSIGRYKGTCAAFTPAPAMQALTGVLCSTSGGGTELHAVARDNEVIVLQVGFQGGVAADPMARERVTSIAIPVGVGVEVAP